MITVHEIEDSIHGLYLVEQSEAESPARLRAFFIDYGDGTNLTLVKNAEGIKIFGVEDTRIILGDPYIDRPLETADPQTGENPQVITVIRTGAHVSKETGNSR